MNCRYSEKRKKKCKRKTGNIQKGMSSKVELTNLEDSFNINKSGDKRKLKMGSR